MSLASTVLYDSCVLFPPSLRDLFVWLGITGACRPRWTAAIHEEWTRSVLAVRSQRGLLKNPQKTTKEHLATLEKVGLA